MGTNLIFNMSPSELTSAQTRFLDLLSQNKGMAQKTLAQLNLNQGTLLDWQDNEIFDHKYRLILTTVSANLDAENAVLAKLRRAEILANGVVQETETITTKISSTGKVTTTRKKTVTRSSPPTALIKSDDMKIADAIKVLVQEGVLPIEQARRIITKCSQFQGELLETFTPDDGTKQQLEDEKVIGLIKAAVLG